jgi:GTPase SAR1 family protein
VLLAVQNGHTPLHLACRSRKSDVARLLLTYGANVHAKARNGFQPMHLVIRSPGSLINSTLVLQALVSFGAAWDPAWDKGKKDQDKYHHALRICVDHWVQQHKKRRAFTSVPVDVLTAGADRTQAYLSTYTMSEVTLRRMLCVVGARGAGKTSLVKSIASDSVPRMEETPTIGINRLALRRFEQVVDDAKQIEIHDVSVWDFCGLDTFHAANALFVPPRAVVLVCVNFASFSTGFMQAAILADTREQEVMLLDEFIETAVRRFVRTILKRHCDVDFVFAVTKQDLLASERDRAQDQLKQTLVAKLNGIERLVHDIKRDLLPNNEETVAIPKFFASCTSPDSIDDARTTIERYFKSSRHRSVEVLDTHMRALDLLRQNAPDPKDRVARAFVGVNGLADKLEMDPQRCRALMRELYTLGEVLYYELLVDVEFFSTTVIMEPLLLMDFIRPVLEYAPFTNQILSHAELETLPHWRDVRDNRQLKAIKQLLHHYDVVFPATADLTMETNSDLIVPASWQTKPPASWLFLGDILRLTSSVGVGAALADRLASTPSPLDEAVRVRWEFCFNSSGLPTPFFDRLMVAIVSANCTVKWDAGPDWIVHRDESKTTACRLMVGRDPRSHLRTMELEAVVAHAASASHTSVLWTRFLQLLRAFVKVRRDMPEAVVASSEAWECRGIHTIDLERLAEFTEVPSSWMPPAETWAQCKELLTKP